MKATEVVRKAIFGMYSIEELKEQQRTIFLKDIDEQYSDFVIDHIFTDKGDGVFYFIVGLYVIDKGHFVPLYIGTNIGYTSKELVNEAARVIKEVMKSFKK